MSSHLSRFLTLLLAAFASTEDHESASASFVYVLSVDLEWPDMSWPDAEQKCKDHGFYLARILSDRDQELMRFKLEGFQKGKDAGFYKGNPQPDCTSSKGWPCGMWCA